jgi:hypothetical protein
MGVASAAPPEAAQAEKRRAEREMA